MSNHPPDKAILAQGLTKRFGTLTAVDHLDLEVVPGEAFALVGPDGAGKTTTMRLLTGIMDADAGQARVLGFDTAGETGPLKEHLGYMPQRFGLYDDLTVAENLAFYADLHRVTREVRRKRGAELLEFANLAPFQSRLAAHLSGGMRQKLGLVCALIHTPQVLFLDEPTFGVDPISRREFWQILYQLLQTGITIFVSTAYMDEAERAHRVGLLDQGKLLAVDTPDALKASFQGDLLEVRGADLRAVRRFLATQPLVLQILARGDSLRLTVANREDALPSLTAAFKEAGLQEMQITPAEPGLEDFFVQLVSRQRE
ncbi:MAG: multidrug ABC transporter ATP-binding protein [Deltaproteobacteria bacterium RBG_13_58_19]|nr:MAG: multidrug ABC transporter ATP-binding protein [Deltaproteobacteria bacterium RBG_13_58_19]